MNNKVLAIAIAAVAVVAAIGTGFAVMYTATTTSSNNVAHYSGNTVDIVDSSGNPVTAPLRIAGPTPDVGGNTTVVSSRLKVSTEDAAGLIVRCWVQLHDARSWVIIDSMTISVDNGQPFSFYNLGTSSIVSSPMTLSAGIHSFTFTIIYKSLSDISLLDHEDIDFYDMSGSKLMFFAGDTDPIVSQTSP